MSVHQFGSDEHRLALVTYWLIGTLALFWGCFGCMARYGLSRPITETVAAVISALCLQWSARAWRKGFSSTQEYYQHCMIAVALMAVWWAAYQGSV